MRIGLFGARACNTGLGTQTMEFYNHVRPDKTCVLDLSYDNGFAHFSHRFGGAGAIRRYPSDADVESFLTNLDVVFTCETPYNYKLFTLARERGIKTINQPNFEFMDHDYNENHNLPRPDIFAMPSMWHFDDVSFSNKVFLPVPVNTEILKRRKIRRANLFLHTVGTGASHDRNGTEIVLAAAKKLSSVQFLIRVQNPSLADKFRGFGLSNVRVEYGNTDNYQDMYAEGDVLLMPRRFGGLCLPVNEALACGIPVIMPDIDPNNRWLPAKWLVKASNDQGRRLRDRIDIFDTNVDDLCRCIVSFASRDISRDSEEAYNIAETISWKNLLPKYMSVMQNLVNSK